MTQSSTEFLNLFPQNFLNPSLKYAPILQTNFDNFTSEIETLCQKINPNESEEHNKNLLSHFLKKTGFADCNINTNERYDLVIEKRDKIQVIIETKAPKNKTEMPSLDKINSKAMQQLVWYFLRERLVNKNLELKNLVITNYFDFFIFDAQIFEQFFARNKDLICEFQDFQDGKLSGTTTDFFYSQIASKYLDKIDLEKPQSFKFIYFNLNSELGLPDKTEIDKIDKIDKDKEIYDQKLVNLFKVFSASFLLKESIPSDANSLNKEFYQELLHILGLCEIQSNGSKIIVRKEARERNPASLLENVITKLGENDKLENLEKYKKDGQNQEEVLFEVALELCITWINRILFLKLLEAQLLDYHNKDTKYKFLSLEILPNFSKLNYFFFEILAKSERKSDEFLHIPHLNSSLFERTLLEGDLIFISNLDDSLALPFETHGILQKNYPNKKELPVLQYLFEFLDSFAFGITSDEIIRKDDKTLINSSVLGLIFEKINGYKDGSFFTPSFVTMYVSRNSVQKAVINQFNKEFSLQSVPILDFDELCNFVSKDAWQKDKLKKYNGIIDNLKILDPSVGSGHFLVSILNEMIAIKSQLGILADEFGQTLPVSIKVVADELKIIYKENEKNFRYILISSETLRIQKTLFHEKQKIIENCLFGVDINNNSVKICQLRLWIELLKNAYYEDGKLQTLPNIDINIKTGNSLISRYNLTTKIQNLGQNWTIEEYKKTVSNYQNAKSKEEKRGFEKIINSIKDDFRAKNDQNDKLILQKNQLEKELNSDLFPLTLERKIEVTKKLQEIKIELQTRTNDYKKALEWRIEFPEVLDDKGNFEGFDVVIGNPPYIQIQSMEKATKDILQAQNYQTYTASGDLYQLFFERGFELLKNGGLLGYITSNKWLRAGYGKTTREFLTKKTPNTNPNLPSLSVVNPVILCDLGGGVFASATVDSSILFFEKSPNLGQTKAAKVSKEELENDNNNLKKISFTTINFDNSEGWFIGKVAEIALKKKIESIGKPLKDWDVKINYGIKTGLNEAFIITREKRAELIAKDPKSAKIIKPILRGRDIKRYGYKFAELYLINSHNGYKKEIPLLKARSKRGRNDQRGGTAADDGVDFVAPIDINIYPAIKEHLDNFEPQLSKRQDKGKTKYNLRNCAYVEAFEKEKLIYSEIVQKPKFYLDTKGGFYAEATSFLMTGKRLKMIMAILHSKVGVYFFKNFYAGGGLGESGFRYKKVFVEQLPIPILDTPEKQAIAGQIEALVERILVIKKTKNTKKTKVQDFDPLVRVISVKEVSPSKEGLSHSETGVLETEIDNLVFDLYELNSEERNLILGQN